MLVVILGDSALERRATMTLTAASMVVGASILADGQAATLLNGVAGVTWFVSSGMFVMAGRRKGASRLQWVGILGLTASVAYLIRPSDLPLAVAGFGVTGAFAAYAAGRDPMLWAKMVPALYLPMHIGTAVAKAATRSLMGMEAHIRTDPPPTAAIVPLVMVGAAIVGGLIGRRFRSTPEQVRRLRES